MGNVWINAEGGQGKGSWGEENAERGNKQAFVDRGEIHVMYIYRWNHVLSVQLDGIHVECVHIVTLPLHQPSPALSSSFQSGALCP